MLIARAQPNEYLVLVKNGRFTNCGVGGCAILWPSTAHALVPSTKQEAAFAMTQETKDGVPLRFKGIIVYRVTQPELAVRQFNFVTSNGHDEIKELLTHVALGRLRALVSHLTMTECIEQRETSLTETVAAALRTVVAAQSTALGTDGWGIDIDVVQVAQVFIIDQALRTQLEAELRDNIRAKSELSALHTNAGIKRAELESARALEREALENERQKHTLALEKLALANTLERQRIETETETRALQHRCRTRILAEEREAQRLANEIEALRVDGVMIAKRAEHDLKKDLIEAEQVTAIATALGHMLQGASLSVYGADAAPLTSLMPALDALGNRLREALARGPKSER